MGNIVQALKKGNQTLTYKVDNLQKKIKELEKENEKLKTENHQLLEKINTFESQKKQEQKKLDFLNILFDLYK